MLNLFALPPKDDQRIEFVSRDAFQLARTDGEEAEEQEAEEDNFTSSRLIKRDRCTTYKIQKRSTICSALNGTQRVGLSYPAQSCTLPAFNTRCVQSGDGCYTAVASQCKSPRAMELAALFSLQTADLAVLASETTIAMCGVAGIV